MFRISVLVALLSFGLLAGCGSSADSWNELDQALGGEETNGCDGTSSAYTDLRGQATVTITANSPWVNTPTPHNACIGVSSGTEVIWEGNFDEHPLVGGVNGTEDSSSPITLAGASGTDPVAVTFVNATDTIDVEGYFCTVHPTTMGGVIAVFP
jgi:hypothetical protein